jgi:hypothetical protein
MPETPNPIQIQKFLGGIDYPARRDDLVDKAQQSGADDNVLQSLRNLPDKEYDGPTEVSEAVTKLGSDGKDDGK